MLVCPQCQYNNPNHSQSCQRCGASLSHKTCPQCDAIVSFKDENCGNCGAFTATVWWAVIAEPKTEHQKEPKLDQSIAINSDSLPFNNAVAEIPQESNKIIFQQNYLDPGQRYRPLIDDDPDLDFPQAPIDKRFIFQGRVVDYQPLQKPVFKALLEQQGDLFNYQAQSTEAAKDLKVSLWHQIGIPELAWPYLNLGKFYPLIPDLHDAWHDGSQEVILLPDRSNWQLLSLVWATQELPALQILYWLNEMAALWTPLSEVRCCQSLLIENNLRVDEDQTFGVLQLYRDPQDNTPTIQDLGRMWQHLLHFSDQPPIEPLEQLISQVITGEIDSITELSLQLENLGRQEQIVCGVEEQAFFEPQSDEEEDSTTPVDIEFYQEDEIFESEDETIIEGIQGGDLSTADLPMQLLSLTDVGYTDVGRQRKHNEDHFGLETQIKKHLSNRGQKLQARGLYIVCDGMGGHASGEVASAMAVDALQRYFSTHWQDGLPDAKTIEEGILLANQAIYQVNQDQDSYGSGRMGTTLVMALIEGTRVVIAHVGDSRIYQINRKWGLEQLTVDHEVGQRAIAEGVDPKIAYSRPDAYQLTQASGPHENQFIKPDIKYLELHEDTLLLLCSDGLSDNKFLETHGQNLLIPLISSSANLDEGLQKLIALANQKNGHDNITAILVRIKLQPSFEQPL